MFIKGTRTLCQQLYILQLTDFLSADHGTSFLFPCFVFLSHSNNSRTIRIWQGEGCSAVLSGHTAQVQSIALLGQDGTFVSAGSDKQILVWRELKVAQRLEGHTQPVRCVKVLPDQSLLSCGNEGFVIAVSLYFYSSTLSFFIPFQFFPFSHITP